jgi:predicted small secreted protein
MQKENYWKVTGGITVEKDYLTFEIWVDALTGSIKKV